jgi:glutamate 5-kinase
MAIKYETEGGLVAMEGRGELKHKRRVVFKVGTSTLTYPNGNINLSRVDRLAMVLSDLANMGKEVILVTSGAIGVGMGKLKIAERPSGTAERQALAAVGQCELMQLYSKLFSAYGHVVAQILLTRDVVNSERPRANAANTVETLLKKGVIPIVNENDSVSTEELEIAEHNSSFGDNDTLSAIVAALVKAGLLIILSDIDGLYDANPNENPRARLLGRVGEITPGIVAAAGGSGSARGTGGMAAKIQAARIAFDSGIDMVLANGESPEVIYGILDGMEVGTLFSRGPNVASKPDAASVSSAAGEPDAASGAGGAAGSSAAARPDEPDAASKPE